jgi:hypothetical protein
MRALFCCLGLGRYECGVKAANSSKSSSTVGSTRARTPALPRVELQFLRRRRADHSRCRLCIGLVSRKCEKAGRRKPPLESAVRAASLLAQWRGLGTSRRGLKPHYRPGAWGVEGRALKVGARAGRTPLLQERTNSATQKSRDRCECTVGAPAGDGRAVAAAAGVGAQRYPPHCALRERALALAARTTRAPAA